MNRVTFRCSVGVAAFLVASLGISRAATAGDKPPPEPAVVEEILRVLNEKGLLDEDEYSRLTARYTAAEKERQSLLPKLKFYGDLRLRGEGFVYDDSDTSDQYRGRYRARLGVDAEVTDFAIVHFRIASSQTQNNSPPGGDSRSENITFGSQPDWGPGPIYIDRAALELNAPAAWVPLSDGKASVEVGKMGNPFVWKPIRDLLLWDGDIAPEGAAVRVSGDVAKGLNVFFNGGYFIDDENSGSRDPHVIGMQAGASYKATDTFLVGGRSTWYGFRSIDANFICRGVNGNNCNGRPGSTVAGGNIADGLTGSTDDGEINVGEFGLYTTVSAFEDWPITAWVDYARNFSAESSALYDSGSDGNAWNTGIVVGDRKKYLEIGFDYLYVEANAFPSQLIESDWIDGRSNREAYVFWLTRRLFANADLQGLVSFGNAIDDSLPAYQNSVSGADRIRFQTDLSIAF
jgi:hypothetical protein